MGNTFGNKLTGGKSGIKELKYRIPALLIKDLFEIVGEKIERIS